MQPNKKPYKSFDFEELTVMFKSLFKVWEKTEDEEVRQIAMQFLYDLRNEYEWSVLACQYHRKNETDTKKKQFYEEEWLKLERIQGHYAELLIQFYDILYCQDGKLIEDLPSPSHYVRVREMQGNEWLDRDMLCEDFVTIYQIQKRDMDKASLN